MGRLQRKKDPSRKKAKKKNQTDAGAQQNDGPVAEIRKRQPVIRKKSAPSSSKPSAVKREQNAFEKSIQFLREVKIELKKVTWPSRKQTLGSTVVVIILVIIISLFLGLTDMGLSSLVRAVLQ